MQELHYCKPNKKGKIFETGNQTLKMKLCQNKKISPNFYFENKTFFFP